MAKLGDKEKQKKSPTVESKKKLENIEKITVMKTYLSWWSREKKIIFINNFKH